MTFCITIALDGPTRGKGRGRAVSTKFGARVFTDDKTRKYESQLRYAAQQVMAGRVPVQDPVRVYVEARFPIAPSWSRKRRATALAGGAWPCTTPDADNLLKCLDALNQVVWIDDRQIVDAHVRKVYSERPGLTILVETVEPGIFSGVSRFEEVAA